MLVLLIKATSLQGLQDIIASNERVVVDFSAPGWCIPCQRLAPHFSAAANTTNSAVFVEVDIDNAPGVSEHYQIMSVPTVVMFVKGERGRTVIARTALGLVKEVDDA